MVSDHLPINSEEGGSIMNGELFLTEAAWDVLSTAVGVFIAMIAFNLVDYIKNGR
jgi:hypothetical protein